MVFYENNIHDYYKNDDLLSIEDAYDVFNDGIIFDEKNRGIISLIAPTRDRAIELLERYIEYVNAKTVTSLKQDVIKKLEYQKGCV